MAEGAGLAELLLLSDRLCTDVMEAFGALLSAAAYRPDAGESERLAQALRLELSCEGLVQNVKALHSLHTALNLAWAADTQGRGPGRAGPP